MTAKTETSSNAIDTNQIKGRSLWQDARRRLVRNRAAMASLIVLMIITLMAIFAPYISPHDVDNFNIYQTTQAPNLEYDHWFGTDQNGRDMFALTLYGARTSLQIGIVAAFVSLVIGIAYGAISGYMGGLTDNLMMRFVDVLYAMPFMFFVILLMVFFDRSMIMIYVALGAVEWLDMARIVRGQTISIKRKEFVEAANATGVKTTQIIIRHIIPNIIGPVVVFMTLLIPKVIMIEAFLSFLGLGVPEPYTSWGKLISDGAKNIETYWWLLIFPAAFLSTTLFCFNFIGDGIRDALDPKDR